MISKWIRKYKIHLIVWGIFISYETIVIGLVYGVFGNPLTYFLHYIIIVCFFYACADIGFPFAFETKSSIWWKLPFIFIISLTMYVVLHYLADLTLVYIGVVKGEPPLRFSYQFVLKNLYRGSYFLGFSTGYYLLKMRDFERSDRERLRQENFENLLKQQKMEKELSLTQNALLKAQINPHFLFNTLDFVYHSIPFNPQEAANAIIYLSRMMRYAIDANKQGEFTKIGEEIKHVQTLLDLYSLRKKNINLPVINCSPKIATLHLIPLVILTLAENMIKHGYFSSSGDKPSITLEIISENLVIKTKNMINGEVKHIESGAGLKNIANRLKIIYGDKASFHYWKEDGHFVLIITIPENLLDKFFSPSLNS